MVGGLAFAKARELVSRLLGRSHPGVSYKNGTHSGKTGRKAVSEHAKLSEVGTGRPQAVRHNDHPILIPALRPRNHLFHPLLWPDGRKGPFPGGCLTMQTKTPYIPTRDLTFMKMKTFLSIGCTTLCQTLRTGSFPAHSSMRKTRSAKMRMEI